LYIFSLSEFFWKSIAPDFVHKLGHGFRWRRRFRDIFWQRDRHLRQRLLLGVFCRLNWLSILVLLLLVWILLDVGGGVAFDWMNSCNWNLIAFTADYRSLIWGRKSFGRSWGCGVWRGIRRNSWVGGRSCGTVRGIRGVISGICRSVRSGVYMIMDGPGDWCHPSVSIKL